MTEDDILFYKCIVCSSVMSARLTLNLEVDYMAKKSEAPEVPKPTVWESNAVVCQCCKFHSNKPSTCNAYKKSVGRKQDATDCKKYKRRA